MTYIVNIMKLLDPHGQISETPGAAANALALGHCRDPAWLWALLLPGSPGGRPSRTGKTFTLHVTATWLEWK
ncbi:hypothetical protein J1605_020815 [Eschrichtius robustus]|uniref:Uncharacterized protein n=1 Tax=Eschrichtius robustus TaxID=9764 RepID=A0AB34HK15_ESCRO|nr:hypothetical protein J1605_020815 [Eschrichtius robustus]